MNEWKIVDPWGREAERIEGTRFSSFELAQEECDWLHEKEGLDTDDGFGVSLAYYRPVRVDEQLKFNRHGIIEYR